MNQFQIKKMVNVTKSFNKSVGYITKWSCLHLQLDLFRSMFNVEVTKSSDS